MIPMLEAQESLGAVQVAAVGSGALSEDAARPILWRWEDRAGVVPHKATHVPEESLRAMGVKPKGTP
jgi:hypothetical protein